MSSFRLQIALIALALATPLTNGFQTSGNVGNRASSFRISSHDSAPFARAPRSCAASSVSRVDSYCRMGQARTLSSINMVADLNQEGMNGKHGHSRFGNVVSIFASG